MHQTNHFLAYVLYGSYFSLCTIWLIFSIMHYITHIFNHVLYNFCFGVIYIYLPVL
jgi:hypothetical protein